MFRGLAVASIISIGMVVLISMFPMPQSDFLADPPMDSPSEKTVVQMSEPFTLDQEHLVSFLKQIPLHHTYQKVNIVNSHLFIDIQADIHNDSEEIFRDAAQVVLDVFTKTTNVQKTYLRFMADDQDTPVQESRVLLLAVMSERDREKNAAMEEDIENMHPRQFLGKYAQVIYGTGWRK